MQRLALSCTCPRRFTVPGHRGNAAPQEGAGGLAGGGWLHCPSNPPPPRLPSFPFLLCYSPFMFLGRKPRPDFSTARLGWGGGRQVEGTGGKKARGREDGLEEGCFAGQRYDRFRAKGGAAERRMRFIFRLRQSH